MTNLNFDVICSQDFIESFAPILVQFEDNIKKPGIVLNDIIAICIGVQLLSADHIRSNGGALKESFSRSKKYKELIQRVNIIPDDWAAASQSDKIIILGQTLIRAINLIPKKYLSDENKLSLTDAILSAQLHLISTHEIPANSNDTHPE